MHGKIEGVTDDYDIPAYNETAIDFIRNMVPSHELGRVFGLNDVDLCCSISDSVDHHEELLIYTDNP